MSAPDRSTWSWLLARPDAVPRGDNYHRPALSTVIVVAHVELEWFLCTAESSSGSSPLVTHVVRGRQVRSPVTRSTAVWNAGHSPPPWTTRLAPDTYPARGEARKRQAPAMSSGVPNRPSGTVADTSAMPAGPP